MASGRIERAQELVELWNSGNFEKWLDEVGSDFEFTPDPSFPDADTYRGGEFRRWMHDWVATWRENRYVLFFEAGHERARRMSAYFDPEQARDAAQGTG